MTDMRATERLLEVIEENAGDLYRLGENFRATYDWIVPIYEAIAELRRRGDTLVRADDIRVILACLYEDTRDGWLKETDPDHDGGRRRVLGVIDRLENALGGKMP